MTTQKIPPKLIANPYSRKPIKESSLLAGRSSEIERISYFFDLTANGQNQRLAVIGERGIGKTSLILCSREISKDKQLLSVSIDLNERKCNTMRIFWQDLFGTLCISAAKVCPKDEPPLC